jgi:hypothetical protein
MEGVDPSLFLVPAQALARARGGRHLLAVRVYNDYAYGGLMGEVKVGRYDLLADRRSPRDMVIGTLVAFFLAIGVYHLAFWLRRRAARENLWFALVSLAISAYGATFSSQISQLVLPFANPYRLGLIALLAGGPFFVALVYALFELRVRLRERMVSAAFVATAAVAAVLPLGSLAHLNRWIDVALAVGMLAIVLRALNAASPHRPHARLLVFGTAAFAGTFVYDLASEYDYAPVAHVLPGVPSLFCPGPLAKRAATPDSRAASIISVAMSRHDPVFSASVCAGVCTPFSRRLRYFTVENTSRHSASIVPSASFGRLGNSARSHACSACVSSRYDGAQ